MKKRYAVIAKVRLQVSGYVKNPEIVNRENNLVVDLENHPQKEEVDIDWFYNEETNTFSKEGAVIYPEPEPMPELEPDEQETALAEMQEMLAEVLLSTEYTACLLEEQMENM